MIAWLQQTVAAIVQQSYSNFALQTVTMKKLAIFLLICLSLLLGCTTYTVPVESFKTQMSEATTENLDSVTVASPTLAGYAEYLANRVDSILVLDKNGNSQYLQITPSIEMRVTDRFGKRHLMYFDTVVIENDTLTGGASRFLSKQKRDIAINDVVKIEVQDGGKSYRYVSGR